jgi:hypothetical protein
MQVLNGNVTEVHYVGVLHLRDLEFLNYIEFSGTVPSGRKSESA